MPISTRSSKEKLLFFSDPTLLKRSICKEKHTSSIDTTSTTSIDTTSTTSINTISTMSIDTFDRATIDSSTRTSIDTNPRADMVAALVLQRDENGDMHDHGGHLCNAADAHVMMLDAQVSQTAEAMKKQEALIKGKIVESERHQVNAILDNDFGEVLEQEKLEEDAFLVESSMSIGRSYWCRPTPKTEHRPTPTMSIDRHQQLSTDRLHQPSIDRYHFWDQIKLFEFRATQISPLDTRILPP
ncbi:hypothetical protein F2Q69_00036272 [Brassica cretica]|uniref:Uncharacterized protein n=1 Tax=Brassica cretica TaxID=69181 RepID=A0A8S9SHH8_BRACR|nr:hypothetical protein F2Q69_00036272 [Brassica cretica]